MSASVTHKGGRKAVHHGTTCSKKLRVRERAIEQSEQFGEVALGGFLVVDRRVGHRVAVERAFVKLRAVADAGLVERVLKRRDLLGSVVAVLICVPEVQLSLDLVG